MDKQSESKILKAALAGAMSLSFAAISTNASAKPAWAKKGDSLEKCLGVSVKGQNDCGSKDGAHGCSGMAKKDKSPNEWVYTPKGLCTKLGGVVWDGKKTKS